MTSETFKKLNKKNGLPDKPGVYFFLKNKKILYIGKATSLRDRTKSYFGKDLINTRGPLILDMVFKSDNIKWKVTDSVLEAIILEANLIKKHQPYYNTKEKDDKSFNYVCITRETLPKVIIVRGKELQKQQNFLHSSLPRVRGGSHVSKNFAVSFAKVFGPYTSGPQLREAIKIIRKIFPFLDEKSKNYLEFYKQINLVPDLKDKKLYLQNIKNLQLFFEGKKKKTLKNLEKEMKEYAKKREFEKAGEIKRQIFALKHINDVALLKNSTSSDFSSAHPSRSTEWDLTERKIGRSSIQNFPFLATRIEAYDIAHMGGKNMVGVMIVLENGEVEKSEYRKFKIKTQNNTNDTGALAEVLERRLAHKEWVFPNLIVVDGGVAQINVTKNILKKMGINIPVVSVVKDERHKPKAILLSPRSDLKGAQGPTFVKKYKKEILLANSEAHRFAINYHKNMRNKNFLKY